jgi:hypothetical protein
MSAARATLADRLRAAAPWVPVRERDLTSLRVGDDEVLVVACDSDGGIGPKPQDAVSVPGEELGRFATRVPLLEVVAAGAEPVLVVDTLAVERDPTGEAIIAGVLVEAAAAGLGADAVTGSTEDNVPTIATGVGVTVLGRATLGGLRVGTAQPPFVVLLLGRPMSAPKELFGPEHPEVLSVPALVAAMALEGVREALPIGSRGVSFEFGELARSAGGVPVHEPGWPVAADQSGGPSTAALLAVDAPRADALRHELVSCTGLPVWRLGTVTATR